MHFIWEKQTCGVFGEIWTLHGLRNDDCAVARRQANGRYVADAWIKGRYLNHHAGTLASAMRRLEREIDKRSIGLLGDDVVTFDRVPT